MVRLKVTTHLKGWKILSYFNSTMVRLKVKNVRNKASRNGLFQFHYGTIKRNVYVNHLVNIINFNSTMVRLKAENNLNPITNFRNFNSTMVRLKVWTKLSIPTLFKDFNSTMVRLKEVHQRIHITNTAFQFHYGTIKSSGSSPYSWCPIRISIPLWYD